MSKGHGALDGFIMECLASGKYRVERDGTLWNTSFRGTGIERKMRMSVDKRGYWVCGLFNPKGKSASVFVHRVVAIALLGHPGDSSMEVDHIDGNKANKNVENLEWVNRSENAKRACALGLMFFPPNIGAREEANPHSALSEDDVRNIHKLRALGNTQKAIALQLKSSPTNVSVILSGKIWQRIYREFHPA